MHFMLSILELPSVKNRTHFLSVQEYHTGYLSKRTELIEGVVLHKMPKSPGSATTILLLMKFFADKITDAVHLRSEQPITLSRSEPEPDIAVVAGKIEDYSDTHPSTAELIIEVSLTTLAEDREMACIYAEAGIPEYWLFNLNNSTVEVYLKPSGERYSEMKTYSRNEILSPLFSSQIKLDLSTIFL